MASPLTYHAATAHAEVVLEGGPVHCGTMPNLRGRRWSYSAAFRGVSATSRATAEADLEVEVVERAALDRMRAVFDADAARAEMGTLSRDGWSTSAMVVGMDVSDVWDGVVRATLHLLMADGVWRRPRCAQVTRPDGGTTDGLDLAYDCEYDLAPVAPAGYVDVETLSPAPVRLVVYGPCANPAVTVGANAYEVRATLGVGDRLELDGLALTCEVVRRDGTRESASALAERGGGPGSGRYCYEPLAPGVSAVRASGPYGFDLAWYEESGELPWVRS